MHWRRFREKRVVMLSDDPVRDFDEWDAERTEWLNKLPKCDRCGEPIQDDHGYELDGEIFCEDCWNRFVDDEIKFDIED